MHHIHTSTTDQPSLGRRQFLKLMTGAAGGLALGLQLSAAHAEGAMEAVNQTASAPTGSTPPAGTQGFEPNAFIRIGTDNTVTVVVKHLEMGQGSHTGLVTPLADELDAAWTQIRTEAAPANASLYGNLKFGGMQGTGGSTSMANSFMQMREAGATARAMLVGAAAALWSVPASEITVKQGVVSHAASQRQASFGDLADAAARQPVPAVDQLVLKTPEQFVYIAKGGLERVDIRGKVNGSALYTQDLQLPGMLIALVAHPPQFGAQLKQLDASAAKAIPGVVQIVPFARAAGVRGGVAVLAKDFWSAKKGRDALKIEWDSSQAYQGSSEDLLKQYQALAQQPGTVTRQVGDAEATLAKMTKTLKAGYSFPYLAHAPMEPLNCMVQLAKDSCELWYGAQLQSFDQMNVAAATGLKPEQVKINTQYAGGSFGRRGNASSDYVLEAVHVARTSQQTVPIKLVWTREDDMQGGFYRPAFYHALRGALDAEGNLVAWSQRLVGQSLLLGTPAAVMMQGKTYDPTSVEGAGEPYECPNLSVELHTPTDVGVPVMWWRSVGHTHTAFATECFMDELAHAAAKDPLDFRRAYLKQHPRHLAVLNHVAERANWGTPLPAGRGRGIALVESFGSIVAEVVEVTLQASGEFKVDRIVAAVDCGLVVNPDVVEAQVTGAIGFGLSAALYEGLTLKEGRVEQSNFHDYPVLRMPQMPSVEVHVLPSTEAPSGIGEPGVPPVAPALANALFMASGKRLYRLPFGTKVA